MKRGEQEVAADVVRWLEAGGHDVYQEVEIPGGVVDIVTLFGPEIWCVEVKTTWRLDLLEQCIERQRFAHRCFAAVPLGKTQARRRSDYGHLFMRLNVGSLNVFPMDIGEAGQRVMVNRMPEVRCLFEHDEKIVRAALKPGHKTHAKAGSSTGGRFTSFRATCEGLAELVVAKPGITLMDAIAVLPHHYASNAGARAHLSHWIAAGKVGGVKIVRDGKRITLHPVLRAV
jgi:hypothetical protein